MGDETLNVILTSAFDTCNPLFICFFIKLDLKTQMTLLHLFPTIQTNRTELKTNVAVLDNYFFIAFLLTFTFHISTLLLVMVHTKTLNLLHLVILRLLTLTFLELDFMEWCIPITQLLVFRHSQEHTGEIGGG